MEIDNKYTSLKLSKLLAENGCELRSDYYWEVYTDGRNDEIKSELVSHKQENPIIREDMIGNPKNKYFYYPAYDLLWDVCVKHSIKFFGQELESFGESGYYQQNCDGMSQEILKHIGYKKDYLEGMIWSNCLFNPKNN